MTPLTSADIDAVCTLVDDLCGIAWDGSKAYLIESRLGNLVTRHGCAGYADLARKTRARLIPGLVDEVVNAVTTNETLWFRDQSLFQALQHKLLPEKLDEKVGSLHPKRLRMWSAACSTGQEPYSLAMTFAELVPDWDTWDVQIVGTDISPAALEHARRGWYGELEMSRGMDEIRLRKYFVRQENGWQVRPEILRMCRFRQHNLQQSFTGFSDLDFIFCRNVAIYFRADGRSRLFEKLSHALAPTGWLIVGAAESLTDLGPQWQPIMHCRACCYQPNGFRVNSPVERSSSS